MALSLTAEQKKILNILKIDEQYIIPEYQRPYSWEYDHCFQLYNDLMEGFNSQEDYFIGNLIIAKSENDDYELDVVDGQQRLTTLFLMIRVLSLFTEDELFKNDFDKILGGMSRKTRRYEYRIKTEVFESDDKKMLEDVLKYEKEKFKELIRECTNKKGEFKVKNNLNQFQQNSIYFYYWFSYFIEQQKCDIDKFINYLLEKVYLLPIELRGKTKEEAGEKALIIFETINNRGMNLEDADIFKAKLYKRAKTIGEEAIFIDLWKTFKNSCDNLNIEIDDVFRYYSHIIRGEQGITTNETNLREFFTIKDYSPFHLKKYKEIMEDLNQIIEVLEFINQEKQKESQLAKWLQLIEAYTNQYPKFALVVYLYKNRNFEKIEYIILESIVRYVYYYGSTAKIKFEIFNIIKKISKNEIIDSYYQNVSIESFEYLGILKYGYALLAFYSDKSIALSKYSTDKIVNLKDKKELAWNQEELESFVDSLGNFIVLDIPKKSLALDKKIAYYQTSQNKEIEEDSRSLSTLNYNDFQARDKMLKEKLVKFFRGEL
ncbi:MAG: hypothetical protein KU29_03665 [Sulfurovum sp. FS06-10]|nr:MAG: hypothetical protein KU29_03665 [Sulfurovum sp. FS06-10]